MPSSKTGAPGGPARSSGTAYRSASLNLGFRLRANVRAMSEGCSARSRRHRGELSSDALEGQVDGEGHPFADVARVSATAGRTITVAAWTLISRITGLLRVVVIG